MLKTIIWAIVFYFIYKTIKNLFKIFTAPKGQQNFKHSAGTQKIEIKKEDIIDAEFEDIKEDNPQKNNSSK